MSMGGVYRLPVREPCVGWAVAMELMLGMLSLRLYEGRLLSDDLGRTVEEPYTRLPVDSEPVRPPGNKIIDQ